MTLVTLELTRDNDFVELGIGTDKERAPFGPADLDILESFAAGYERAITSNQANEIAEIGCRLANWLNSKNGWLRRMLDEAPPPLHLEIRCPIRPQTAHRTLLEAPWEILSDSNSYIAADVATRFTPVRRIGPVVEPLPPRPGALSVLFMAAAPHGEQELSFEEEEARILDHTATLGLDLFVEDTGTVHELRQRAAELGADPDHALHVLHITCHGTNHPEPALLLEDEVGEPALAPAANIVDSLGGRTIKQLGLFFLSACSTAASRSSTRASESLALVLSRAGVPAVLGWAAPVSDESATRFAARLYQDLAYGDIDLEQAVARTRTTLLNDPDKPDPHWHLARLFLGPTGGGLIALPNGPRRKGPAVHYGFLGGDRRSPVAGPEEFVGRRRLLQHCLRILRRTDQAGLLLHGPGNVGKSSLAARVVDRMSQYQAVVLYGRFDGWNLVEAIHHKLGSAVQPWYERHKHCADNKIGIALRELFDTKKMNPLLLVLDDFEQQLEAQPGATHRAREPQLIGGVIAAFQHASTRSRLVITSRYTFTLTDERGHEMTDALATIPVASFTDREANKRARRQPPPSTGPDLRQECANACRGNPAVLSLLLRLANNDTQRCRCVLEQITAIEKQEVQDEDLNELLAKIAATELLASLGSGDWELLRRSMIFHSPLPIAVAPLIAETEVACDGDGERLIGLGVWEEIPDPTSGRAFTLNPLVSAYASREVYGVTPALERALAEAILPTLSEHWQPIRGKTGDLGATRAGWEVVRLAMAAEAWQVAADFGRLALAWWERTAPIADSRVFAKGYVEQLEANGIPIEPLLCLEVAKLHQHSEEVEFQQACLTHGIENAESTGLNPAEWALLLLLRSDSYRQVGEIGDALADLDRLLKIYSGLAFDYERAIVKGRIADIQQMRGELDEALRIRKEEELPVYERFGDVRLRAITLGKVADILYARGDLDEALRIHREEELPVFERLGDVREAAVAMSKVAGILQTRGNREEALRIQRELVTVFERLGDVRARAITFGHVADILEVLGEVEEALQIRREEELPVFERLGDVQSRAVTIGKIADAMQANGDLDEALRIRREEQLPIFERLGDIRERATTMGLIAGILQVRGDLDEALRIRREEELPVFERLGDIRARAVTMGQIANILQARGELDEALRIRLEEQLPVYERLGDVAELAATYGRIADILQLRGELDKALSIWKDKLLPIYTRSGNIRERAVTLGRIADILKERGDLNEALRIRQEEELPVFERLGDVLERANSTGKIADILQARGELDEALRVWREEVLPIYTQIGDVRCQAIAWGRIADILIELGEFDEALRIRREEELPVFERLGDVRERAITIGKVADVHKARGDLEVALRIRCEEQLPVFIRLGDVRSQAVVWGRIADIRETQGDLDEALRIRQEEELPVFERLGDVRERATTVGKVADILQARGELDEALRIRCEELLPVFKRLRNDRGRAFVLVRIAEIHHAKGQLDKALQCQQEGLRIYEQYEDVISRAITLGKMMELLLAGGRLDEAYCVYTEKLLPIPDQLDDTNGRPTVFSQVANLLMVRGDLDKALRIYQDEVLPAFIRLGAVKMQAVIHGRIALILRMLGKFNEAVRIHREKEFPIHEQLGDRRELLIAKTNLAITLANRGRKQDESEVIALLASALKEARRLRIPEAQQIAALVRQLGKNPNKRPFI